MELSTHGTARTTANSGAAEPRADIAANARNVIMTTRASFAHPIPTGRCDEPDCTQSRARRARRAFRGR